jgi:predicted membrane-bound spermidine synthase
MMNVKLVIGLGIGLMTGTLAVISPDLIQKSIKVSYDDQVTATQRTAYQQIVLTNTNNNFCLFLNGNTQLCQKDQKVYHQALVDPVVTTSRPKRVLVLGGGDGLAVRRVMDLNPTAQIVQIELDPDMINFARSNPELSSENKGVYKGIKSKTILEYSNSPKSDAFTVITGDADVVVNSFNALGKFDSIIVDYPDPNDIGLSKLFSVQHYKKLARLLNNHGLLVVQSSSYRETPQSYSTIGQTLRASGFKTTIPYNVEVNSFGGWGFWMASKQELDPTLLTNEVSQRTTSFDFLKSTRFPLVNGKNYFDVFVGQVNTLNVPNILISYLREEEAASLDSMKVVKLQQDQWQYSYGQDKHGNKCLLNLNSVVVCNRDVSFVAESLNLIVGSSVKNIGVIGSVDSVTTSAFTRGQQVEHYTTDLVATNSILNAGLISKTNVVATQLPFVSNSLKREVQVDLNPVGKVSKLLKENTFQIATPVVNDFKNWSIGTKDVIILDVDYPSTMDMSKFYTQGFLKQAQKSLSKDGKFVTVLGGWSVYPKTNGIVLNTLSTLYKYNQVYSVPTPFKGEVTFIVSSNKAIEQFSEIGFTPQSVNLQYLMAHQLQVKPQGAIETSQNPIIFTQFNDEVGRD